MKSSIIIFLFGIIATTAVSQEYLKTDGTNSMTGRLKLERAAPILELFETDSPYSWYLVNDNKILSIRRGDLSTQALTIDSRGYVGIGITNPTANFIVRGSGDNNSFKHFVVEDQYGNEDLVFDGLGRLKLGYDATFPTGDSFKLSVDGKAIAEEIVVKLSGAWPDYVFAEGYQLMPLPELEKYLQEFKHLPNIPTAAEIEEKGQSLGEMNALLLKKIEELTLYVIELKKENDKLKSYKSAIDELAEKIRKLESR